MLYTLSVTSQIFLDEKPTSQGKPAVSGILTNAHGDLML